MKNLATIHRFLAEKSWTSRFWIEADVASADVGRVDLLLLKEVALIRDSGHPQLSLDLIELARNNGFNTPWLLDNQARAHIRLSENSMAYQIWRGLLVSSDDMALRQSCVRALLNFKVFDALAHADLQLQSESTEAFQSALTIAADLMKKKEWAALQAVLASLTQQLLFHPTISYYRAVACLGAAQASDCLMICDVLLAGPVDDSELKQRITELADSVRSDRSLHYDIDEYQSKLKVYFQEFGWRPVVVTGREQSVAVLAKSVVKEAIYARDSGLTQMSLSILNLTLLFDSNNPWALENKARALCLLGDYHEAMDICRDILRTHAKHRAKDSALSMLEKYDRNYKLSSIYADVERLASLGSAQRQEAFVKLQTSFAVGYTPEAARLMKQLIQADSIEGDLPPSHPLLKDVWPDLKANTEVNRGLSLSLEPLMPLTKP